MGNLEREEQAKADLAAIRVSLFMILLVIIVWLLVGCGGRYYGSAMIGQSGRITQDGWENPATGLMLRGGVRWGTLSCSLTHISDPTKGNGVNDEPDYYTSDHIGCGVEF